MADPDKLLKIKAGVTEWNRSRIDDPDGKVNLSGADLRDMDLRRANFFGADLSHAKLNGAKLYLATFRDADLTGADLTGADLGCAHMVNTKVDQAVFTGCIVYGLSAWDLKGKPKDQSGLIVTPKYELTSEDWEEREPVITVDDLQTAQFIHLLLNNKNITNALNTLTAKAVLILGRFSDPTRKAVLDGLRERLKKFDLLPVVFDFDRPTDKDYTETVQTLTGMSMFVIADITNPKSTPMELEAIIKQFKIPYVPIIDRSVDPREFAMLVDSQNSFHWVLDTVGYTSKEQLLKDETMRKYIIDPVNEKRKELREDKSIRPKMIMIEET